MWKSIGWKVAGAAVKKWLLPFLVVVLVSGLGYSHWWAHNAGARAERAEWQQRLIAAQETARKRQEELADALEREQARKQIQYRDRIRYVQGAADPSGCADALVPDGVLDALGWTDAD